jgi:hypothetical protein
VPHLRFAKFLILDSVPAGEFATGRNLLEALEPYCAAYRFPIPIERRVVSARQELLDTLEHARLEALRTDRIPLVHIECHGNDDGLRLAGGDFLYWEQLSQALTALNTTTRFNLFVSVAACFGAYLVSELVPTKRAPVSACLSITKEAYPDQLLQGFRTFYQTLLTTDDGNRAIAALKAVNQETDQSFYLGEATDFFVRTYTAYLAKLCTPAKYRERAQFIQEDQRERGLPVSPIRDIEQLLLGTEREQFERAKVRYFMIDEIPENDARFPVAWSDVDTRSPSTA